MEWPNRFLLIVMFIGLATIVAPWRVRRARCASLVAFIPPFAATACWAAYETHLNAIARAGDPLIRIDLFLIVPIIGLAWLSALASIAYKRFRRSNA